MLPTEHMLNYMDAHSDEALQLLIELAQIPAPSNFEQQRAEFCKVWLQKQGARGVYIDDALNVVYPIGCTETGPLAVFMAHSDVVFPDTSPLPLTVEEDLIKCPGVGDDTANVVALLMCAKYIAENGFTPSKTGVLLVINSGEEGLGNLKGSRQIMDTFGSRVREFITFDGGSDSIVHRAVGSYRCSIAVDTEGGHSYGNFGNRNAIACLAAVINDLYAQQVPEQGKTTYNVGLISGGTSVNTIAQHAEMLYEYRSDDRTALEIMATQLQAVLQKYRDAGLDITVATLGERPCSGEVDGAALNALMQRAAQAAKRYYGHEVTFGAGSTDCNIPLSRGIPAICAGCCQGSGAHAREETVQISSLLPGLKVCAELVLHHF